MGWSWGSQARILLYKNWILQKRNLKATVIQLVVPFLFILAIFLLQFALKENNRLGDLVTVVRNPTVENVAYLQPCKPLLQSKCYAFFYAPAGDWAVDLIATKIRDRAKSQSTAQSGWDIKGFKSGSEMFAELDKYENISAGAYEFDIKHTDEDQLCSPVLDLTYTIAYNQSNRYKRGRAQNQYPMFLDPLLMSGEQEIFQFLKTCGPEASGGPLDNSTCRSRYDTEAQVTLRVQKSEYPHPELSTLNAIAAYGPIFIFGAIMFNFVIHLGQIVTETEMKLREGMKQMGLKDSVFWTTWAITCITWNLITSLILIISGCIFQFSFFLKNDFPLYFFLFFLFGCSMSAVAFFFSTLVSKAQTASSIGFVVYLIGLIIQYIGPDLIFTETTNVNLVNAFSFLPFALLGKGLNDLGNATAKESSVGLRWSERFEGYFSMHDVYCWLIIDFFFYFAIALYFDNVIPSQYGVSQPLWYPFLPSYWGFRSSKPNGPRDNNTITVASGTQPPEDEDVREEERMVRTGELPPNTAVRIINLRKVYKKKMLFFFDDPAKDFVAVQNLCLSMEEGKLFCMLGHNGAGKTTTFNMMTGLFAPTSGDAYIFGHSITTDQAKIRQVMGVCPQHDILWSELTGREHLRVYAGFKGLARDRIDAEVDERLKDVELEKAANVPAGNYSGGMRRRLSVAIALIGNPSIVFLDEPTTGMDPVSRRQVWTLIEKVKRERVIVLTTHSMEEADILGDRIGIMKRGRLSVIGTPLRLKNKFGTGYRMTLLYEHSKRDAVQAMVGQQLPGCTIMSELPGCTQFQIPRNLTNFLPQFFDYYDAVKDDLCITDVQLSLTTLEEVFMLITQGEEVQQDLSAVLKEQRDGSRAMMYCILGCLCCIPYCFNIYFFLVHRSRTTSKKAKRLGCCSICGIILWVILIFILLAAIGRSRRQNSSSESAEWRPAEPIIWAPSAAIDYSNFPSPIQIGDPSSTQAFVSFRSSLSSVLVSVASLSSTAFAYAPVTVTLSSTSPYRVAVGGQASSGTPSVTLSGTAVGSATGTQYYQYALTLTGLTQDTPYGIVAFSTDSAVRSKVTRFRTAWSVLPASGSPRLVRFGASSGLGDNSRSCTDALIGYFNVPESLSRAGEIGLDFFVVPGHAVNQSKSTTQALFDDKWSVVLGIEGVRTVMSSAHTVSTPGYAEFGWVLSGSQPVMPYEDTTRLGYAQAAFKSGVAGPWIDDSSAKLYRTFSYGKLKNGKPVVDVFVLDCLTERASGQVVSATQLSWLTSGLQTSQTQGTMFKVVVSSVPVSPVGTLLLDPSNSWNSSAPAQRLQLLSYIITNKISGVLFISGGMQLGAIVNSTAGVPGGYPSGPVVPEIIVGPASTRINRAAEPYALRSVSYFGVVIDLWTYADIELNPVNNNVVVKFMGELGEKQWEQTISLQAMGG